MEVDPFEARLEFLSLLGKLNASQHSIQKVGNFAMRNRNLYEDLYSCIIEELEQTPSINAKMNIFYVLDLICHQSHKAGFSGYTDLIQKNLPRIVECVNPSGPKGNVNVAGTRKILDSWRAKKVFHESVIDRVEKPLLSRELGANAVATTEAGFTKEDILRRMDEDRERHKRIREEIWIRPAEEDPAAEFLQNWDDVSDLEDNDFEDMENENKKYLPGYPWPLEFDRFLPSPAIFQSKSASLGRTESPLDSSTGATKRLTSPEGTVSVSSTGNSPLASSTASAADHAHNDQYRQPGHDQSPSYSYPPSNAHHQHQQLRHIYHPASQSRTHSRSHSYHDRAIPLPPAADTSSSSRGSPSYGRTQYHERTIGGGGSSDSNGLNTAHSNGYGEHVP